MYLASGLYDPRPPTEALRVAQDHPERPQERPKTGNLGTRAAQDRTQAQRAAQDSEQRPQDSPRPPAEVPRAVPDGPPSENIEDKIHRQNMLTVNCRSDRRATCPLTISL